MKVLHITSWYPNTRNSKEAIFIYRQVEALSTVSGVKNKVIHLSIDEGSWQFLNEYSYGADHTIIKLPINRWFLIEFVAGFCLLLVLFRARVNQYDLINFHIAYPNLTYWHWIKKWVRPKVVITEHWSAYHFNFNLAFPPKRIKRIFQQDIPVITVSKALLEDIQKFSDSQFKSAIVPNIVETDLFKPDPNIKRIKNRFFMVAQWKLPKDPFCVLEAFNSFRKAHHDARLIIGGYGPQLVKMKQKVEDLALTDRVDFLGKMKSADIAIEMQKARAYIHSSTYETFSVVCAEAMSCGCPVIASNVGGIPEFINDSNGVLVSHQTSESFLNAMKVIVKRNYKDLTGNDFTARSVGKRYKTLLDEIRG